MKSLFKKIIPRFILNWYHLAQGILAALLYHFPARHMICIGVTGTNGKTTTCNMIADVLSKAGYKVGLSTTVNFRIGLREWINDTKMTVNPPFMMQRLLRDMSDAGCKYAVLEVSSHALAQHRLWGIPFSMAIFTNLTPEHIEYHGGFEEYKKIKGRLFKRLVGRSVSIVNLDDEVAEYFLNFKAGERWGYSVESPISKFKSRMLGLKIITAQALTLGSEGVQFKVSAPGEKNFNLQLKILGSFNIYNALASICLALSQDIDINTIKESLKEFKGAPGRMEEIQAGIGFRVIVDYAHTPEALKQVYETLHTLPHQRIISVLGACGDRDKAKRPKLGKLASKMTDLVVIANEDPYTENPDEIINQIITGARKQKKLGVDLFKIPDRSKAIKFALSKAREDDIVVVTGKGAEQSMVWGDKKIPWDDRDAVRLAGAEIQREIGY